MTPGRNEEEAPLGPLTAFRTPEASLYPEIVPASPDRAWMDEGTRGWANRCLPLRIANANGWFVLNPTAVEIEWNGNRALEALTVRSDAGAESLARSMFGFGIVTFVIPYLFRTPPGFNLLSRGPANQPKDGVAPLEGIVETDWLPFTFTMNWQVTRPRTKVRFEAGEPIALLVPLRRGETESFTPEIRNLASEPALREKFDTWLADRQEVARQKADSNYQAKTKQGHYIRGQDHFGDRAAEHQAKLRVRPFVEIEPAPVVEPRAVAAAAGQGAKPNVWQRYFGSSGNSK